MTEKKKGPNWKELGQFVAILVKLFSVITATFKKMKVDAELIEWAIGSGKDFFVGKLQEIGAEFQRQIVSILRAEIDTDIDPSSPFQGAKIEKHARVGKVAIELRADGCLYVDRKKVVLFRSEQQMNGKVVKGYEIRTELDNQPVLSASILDFLLAHREFIPEEWKKDQDGKTIYVYFWGTIYRNSVGDLYVRYLVWNDGAWDWGCSWLDNDWHSDSPAAMSAS